MAAHGPCPKYKSAGRHKKDCPRLAELRAGAPKLGAPENAKTSAEIRALTRPLAKKAKLKALRDVVARRPPPLGSDGAVLDGIGLAVDLRALEKMSIQDLVALRSEVVGELKARYQRNREERVTIEGALGADQLEGAA